MKRLYTHFAIAYGTFWLALMVVAVLTNSHVRTGTFGMCAVPIIALIYSICRVSLTPNPTEEIKSLRARVQQLESQLRVVEGRSDYR